MLVFYILQLTDPQNSAGSRPNKATLQDVLKKRNCSLETLHYGFVEIFKLRFLVFHIVYLIELPKTQHGQTPKKPPFRISKKGKLQSTNFARLRQLYFFLVDGFLDFQSSNFLVFFILQMTDSPEHSLIKTNQSHTI
jgi:hypothetical protein